MSHGPRAKLRWPDHDTHSSRAAARSYGGELRATEFSGGGEGEKERRGGGGEKG